MGMITLNGAKTIVNTSVRGAAVTSGILTANAWYEVLTIGSSSALPIEEVTAVFRTPDTSQTPITLAAGDSVYPLTLTKICKADSEVNFEEGTIEVTDDCEEGFVATITDGFRNISGSLTGFAKFDDDTGELSVNSQALFNRFINLVTDDGAGVYVETKAANEKVILFICLNINAAVGDMQNWLIVPAIFSALAAGAALKAGQKRDITWTKAQGYASLYERTVYAADVIT